MKAIDKDYRRKALKILPWVCGKCGREFSGRSLRLLTVHHKDHNPANNPADGSNWELLCIYCHDNEHSRALESVWLSQEGAAAPGREEQVTHTPFAELGKLMGRVKE